MNYEKIISKEIFKAIDRTFFEVVLEAGPDAAAQAAVMGVILRRKVSDYITDTVEGIRDSIGGETP